MKTVYVVTGLELGWDCVVGVFESVSIDELNKRFPESYYIIHERELETVLKE